MAIVYTRTAATYSHATGVAEQTVMTYSPIANNIVKGIWLDLVNLTQNCTIRVKYQVDGTNYRTFEVDSWTTSMDDGVLITGDLPVAVSKSLRVTLQSTVAEGASRDIPYEVWSEGLGSGAIAFTYTLTNSVTGDPIQGAEIWATTDSAGSNVVASGLSNSSGQVLFYLDAGTIYFWAQHPDFSFTNPDQETIA